MDDTSQVLLTSCSGHVEPPLSSESPLSDKQQKILDAFGSNVQVCWMGDNVEARCSDCQVTQARYALRLYH